MIRCAFLLCLLLIIPALAEQPAKDRKDFMIEALTQQRDRASLDAASCVADANTLIAKLNAEIADLKTRLPKDHPSK
jgi:hypothetical protein